jgi:hypothetical protein
MDLHAPTYDVRRRETGTLDHRFKMETLPTDVVTRLIRFQYLIQELARCQL